MPLNSPLAPADGRAKPVPFTTYPAPMAIVTTIFFMWGLITVLNDILIPHLKAIFSLNYAEAMMVQFCFFSTYFVTAYPFGKLVERVGYQKTMVVGLTTAGVGALLFLPAALVASFPLFLFALVIVATGITALQVSANPYVSILGQPESASSRLNLAQAFNSLGTTIAPKVGGILILGAVGAAVNQTKVQEAHSVILPYVVLAGILFLLAIAVGVSKLPQMLEMTESTPENKHVGTSVWKHRHTVLGALGIFLYVGAEVSIGSFLVSYFHQKEIGNLTLEDAAGYVSLYWGCAMVGRFIGSAVLQKVKAGTALGWVALAAGILVVLSMLTSGHIAMATIIVVGLFNSVMFPNIFTLGIADLGPLTGEGSGLLIAAIVGGAIIPLAQGVIADKIGIHHAFLLPVLCYMYIIYYGFIGSKPVPVK
jgi:FHS family L-fucose permease-like MFS transporter